MERLLGLSYIGIFTLFFFLFSSTQPAKTCSLKRYKWIGDTLVFDDNCYSFKSFAQKHKSLVFVGDSLSRRLAYTLASLLMGETSTLDLARDPTGSHRQFNQIYNSNVSFFWAPCITTGLEFFQKNKDKYSLFIFSQGIHYLAPSGQCVNSNFFEDYDRFQRYHAKYKDKLIYRSQPMSSRVSLQAQLLEFIEFTRNKTTTRYLDHSEFLKERRSGKHRIVGNSFDHFGTQARLALAIHTFEYLKENLLF